MLFSQYSGLDSGHIVELTKKKKTKSTCVNACISVHKKMISYEKVSTHD